MWSVAAKLPIFASPFKSLELVWTKKLMPDPIRLPGKFDLLRFYDWNILNFLFNKDTFSSLTDYKRLNFALWLLAPTAGFVNIYHFDCKLLLLLILVLSTALCMTPYIAAWSWPWNTALITFEIDSVLSVSNFPDVDFAIYLFWFGFEVLFSGKLLLTEKYSASSTFDFTWNLNG